MNLEFFRIYYDLAVDTYHVDPRIFIFLMVASVPFYYYGWFGIGKAILKFRNSRKNEKLKTSDFFSQKYFLKPLIVNRIAWVMPYVYVIFWGRDLPFWFWVLLVGWIILITIFFKTKIERKLVE